MTYKIILEQVVRALEKINNTLSSPFKKLDEDTRHEESLEIQNKHHEAILRTQNTFYKETLAEQKTLNTWTKRMSIATIFTCGLTIVIIILGVWGTLKELNFQKELYHPKINAQIIDHKWAAPHYTSDYKHVVTPINQKGSVYVMPIYVEIANTGLVPFQLYQISVNTLCGKGNSGSLNVPENVSKLIAQNERIEFTDNIGFEIEGKIEREMPCEINFVIHGTNSLMKKRIILTT